MSYYEYLRRLYIKELYLITGLSIPLSLFLCIELGNHWLGTAVLIGLVPTSLELYLLNRKKNIESYESLVLPRTIHFIAYYLIIMLVSLTYSPFRFEYLLFIPLGISATAFHPYFGRKIKDILFYYGLASAIGLFIYEFNTENFITPLGIENYMLAGYSFGLTAIFIYQANVANERSKSQHKKDKKELQSRLEELEDITEERDELTYNLISNFRRTVSDIDADFELIGKACDRPDIKKMSHSARRKTQELSSFLDNYVAGRQHSYKTISISDVDINTLIVNELNTHYDRIQRLGFDLSFEPYVGDIFYSDRAKIQTIVSNLIQNAIDFKDATRSNSKISIRLKAKQDAIELTIKDNGVGITKENIPHIFKVFYSTKKESEGKGLYETKRAAQQIGAELKIASKAKKGTTAKVLIPTMSSDIN